MRETPSLGTSATTTTTLVPTEVEAQLEQGSEEERATEVDSEEEARLTLGIIVTPHLLQIIILLTTPTTVMPTSMNMM
jgi:hypothetical protein